MIGHLTDEQIQLYRKRQLTAAARLDVSDHMQMCDRCRERISESRPESDTSQLLGFLDEELAHLAYEHMAGYVDGILPAEETAEAGQHLEDCLQCAADVAALKEVKAELRVASSVLRGSSRWSSVLRQRWWTTGLAVAAGVAIMLLVREPRKGGQEAANTAVDAAQSHRPGVPAPPPSAAPVAPSVTASQQKKPARATAPSRGAILSFVLTPGVMRGDEPLTVAVPESTAEVRLQLVGAIPSAYRSVDMVLTDSAEREVWRGSMPVRRSMAMILPVQQLSPGNYRLTVSATKPSGEPVVLHDYAFRFARG